MQNGNETLVKKITHSISRLTFVILSVIAIIGFGTFTADLRNRVDISKEKMHLRLDQERSHLVALALFENYAAIDMTLKQLESPVLSLSYTRDGSSSYKCYLLALSNESYGCIHMNVDYISFLLGPTTMYYVSCLVFILLISLLLVRLFANSLKNSILDPLNKLSDEINSTIKSKEMLRISKNDFVYAEFNDFYSAFAEIAEKQRDSWMKYTNERKKSAIADTVQMIAHDLKLPLATVRKILDNRLTSDTIDSKEALLVALKRIDNLVMGLRNRDPDNIVKPKWTKIPIKEIESELRAYTEAQNKVFSLRSHIHSDCYIDLSKLQRSLTNLTQNAIEAANSQVHIDISTLNDSTLLVEVADDGEGICSEILENTFSKGYTTKRFGNGLGLPYVKQIVEGHGGTLSYQRKNLKSVFSIRIPDCVGVDLGNNKIAVGESLSIRPPNDTKKEMIVFIDVTDPERENEVKEILSSINIDYSISESSERSDVLFTDKEEFGGLALQKPLMKNFHLSRNKIEIGVKMRLRIAQQRKGLPNEQLIQI